MAVALNVTGRVIRRSSLFERSKQDEYPKNGSNFDLELPEELTSAKFYLDDQTDRQSYLT